MARRPAAVAIGRAARVERLGDALVSGNAGAVRRTVFSLCVLLFLVYYCYYFLILCLYIASAKVVRRSAAEALRAQLVSSTKIEGSLAAYRYK